MASSIDLAATGGGTKIALEFAVNMLVVYFPWAT